MGGAATLFRRAAGTAGPSPVCRIGTNIIGAELEFDASTAEYGQRPVGIYPSSVTSITAKAIWRSAATSGDVRWCIQTAFVADGASGDPSWNTAQCVNDTAQGTTLLDNSATITSALTTTGSAAGSRWMIRIYRDAADGADTMSGDALLIGIVLTITP